MSFQIPTLDVRMSCNIFIPRHFIHIYSNYYEEEWNILCELYQHNLFFETQVNSKNPNPFEGDI